jgi:hypothetical protein
MLEVGRRATWHLARRPARAPPLRPPRSPVRDGGPSRSRVSHTIRAHQSPDALRTARPAARHLTRRGGPRHQPELLFRKVVPLRVIRVRLDHRPGVTAAPARTRLAALSTRPRSIVAVLAVHQYAHRVHRRLPCRSNGRPTVLGFDFTRANRRSRCMATIHGYAPSSDPWLRRRPSYAARPSLALT